MLWQKKSRFKNHKKSGVTLSKKDIKQGFNAKGMSEFAKDAAPDIWNEILTDSSRNLKTASPALQNALLTEFKKIVNNS